MLFGLESQTMTVWEEDLLKLLDARERYSELSVALGSQGVKIAKLATVTTTLAATSISPSAESPSGRSQPASPTKRKRNLPEETEFADLSNEDMQRLALAEQINYLRYVNRRIQEGDYLL